ncbi:MAG: cell division protein FtsQ/DivIB [Gallionella sp.]|nr:cell division protein FtsQ/DivIB [Gallionella sp.]
MWDNAPLLRNIANTLFVFSMFAVLYGAAYYVVHLPGLFPVHSVRLSTAPQRVDPPGVLEVVRNEVQGNFFTADIERLRQSLEKLPWVRNVSIRREFPHRLVVQMEEHQALARWNNSALVNRQGEVFVADSEQMLPAFVGQEGTSHEVAQHYAQFSQQLASLNLQAAQLALSPRHAWQLRLSNGMVLELGRENMQQRLERFVSVYPYIGGAGQDAADRNTEKYVDLRYRNGFAVRHAAEDKKTRTES